SRIRVRHVALVALASATGSPDQTEQELEPHLAAATTAKHLREWRDSRRSLVIANEGEAHSRRAFHQPLVEDGGSAECFFRCCPRGQRGAFRGLLLNPCGGPRCNGFGVTGWD